jgi:hypothetical protein
MATPPNDESRELFRLLADQQWHPHAEVKNSIARKVPPGRALRKYQEDIESRRRMYNDPTYDTPHDDAMRIELGARRCAQSAISSWSGKGVLIEGKGENKMIKVKPGFSSWGIPGFEPKSASEEQDPSSEPPGYTEVPPEDSGRSESEMGAVEQQEHSKPNPLDFLSRVLAGHDVGPIYTSEGPRPEPKAEVVPEQPPIVVAEQPSPELVEQLRQDVEWAAEHPHYGASESARPETAFPAPAECSHCGGTVGDWRQHELWHQQFVKTSEQPEMVLLNESQLREVLGGVVGQALDRFQSGMQNYLDTQFAHVNGALLAISTMQRRDKPKPSWQEQSG